MGSNCLSGLLSVPGTADLSSFSSGGAVPKTMGAIGRFTMPSAAGYSGSRAKLRDARRNTAAVIMLAAWLVNGPGTAEQATWLKARDSNVARLWSGEILRTKLAVQCKIEAVGVALFEA